MHQTAWTKQCQKSCRPLFRCLDLLGHRGIYISVTITMKMLHASVYLKFMKNSWVIYLDEISYGWCSRSILLTFWPTNKSEIWTSNGVIPAWTNNILQFLFFAFLYMVLLKNECYYLETNFTIMFKRFDLSRSEAFKFYQTSQETCEEQYYKTCRYSAYRKPLEPLSDSCI